MREQLSLIPLLPAAMLLSVALLSCSDDAGGSPADSGGDSADAAVDGSSDTTPDSGDDVEQDAMADAVDDVIAPTCFEEDRERAVGNVCARDNNRICLDNSHCRSTELCEIEGSEEFGTCIYQVPDPIDCPGGPGCADVANAPLRAAFAARTITPLGWELARDEAIDGRHFVGDPLDPETFWDCGRDMICPGDDDYVGPDADGSEGDERMQGIWMGGLSESVPALPCPPELLGESCSAGVDCCAHERAHDDIWARGVVFEQGNSKVALVVVDLIGFFYSDIQDIAAELPANLDIDLLIVSSTHAHEGPDTMGLWGPGFGGSDLPVESGIDRAHIAYIRSQVVDLVAEANGALTEVDIYATSVHTGVDLVAGNDSRDPWIFDDNMALMHVVRAGGDRGDPDDTVGVLVNWGNHPEAIGSNNNHISSDYPHYVRSYVENGLAEVMNGDEVVPAIDGLGGTAVFLSGTLGGLTTPLHTSAVGRDGTVVDANGFAKAEAMGQRLAQIALESLATAPAISGDLSFGMREFLLRVPNLRFHIAIFSLDLFPDREIYNWRYTDGFEPDDPPELLSAMARLQIGPVSLVTVPGEMFPETVVGGFRDGDSEAEPVRGNPNDRNCMSDLLPPEENDSLDEATHPCLIDPTNPNPPDLDTAPTGGWVQDELPGDVLFLVGNGMDSIGYLVPAYDFQLSEGAPYVSEPEGDHYEETNGIGPVIDDVLDEMESLWNVENLFE